MLFFYLWEVVLGFKNMHPVGATFMMSDIFLLEEDLSASCPSLLETV